MRHIPVNKFKPFSALTKPSLEDVKMIEYKKAIILMNAAMELGMEKIAIEISKIRQRNENPPQA